MRLLCFLVVLLTAVVMCKIGMSRFVLEEIEEW